MRDETHKIPYLPERIQGLERLSLNLWWRWDRRARRMLKSIEPVIWSGTRHNPVAMLRRTDPGRLAHLAKDPQFLELYDEVMADFDDHLSGGDTWFEREFPGAGQGKVAYFCAEFGLHNSIPIYSGGLGVLAGDHCKSASDLGVPLIGVGLLYSKGYFDQKLNLEGWQENSDEVFDPLVMPLQRLSSSEGSQSLTVLETSGRPVHIGAWSLDAGRVRLYLLDTNLPENHPEDRQLTYQLYGGGVSHRLKQEWILGVGGVRVLRALGVEPAAWHANEGHAAFMLVERVQEGMKAGSSFDEAVEEVRARSVFTTHTPVPAGHDVFSHELIEEVCGGYWTSNGFERERFFEFGRPPGSANGEFHMTAAAIRLSRGVNGVSRKHGAVTRGLWRGMWPGREVSHVPIGSVTNGVHVGSWMAHRYMELLDGIFGERWEHRPDRVWDWDRVRELDDGEVWGVHTELKRGLLDYCREQARTRWRTLWKESAHLIGAGTLLSAEPLTIGFARRFATYKRAHLLFRDEDRLQRLLTDPWRPVQIVFAGKAHPADDNAKAVLQKVWAATRESRFEGRIAFVEDYDLHVAHRLVQGVDLWLNLPRVPLEASGTSGMKAALNCVPQLSTLDGWWAEGFNSDNGWAIPLADEDPEAADAADHEALFTLLEREVVPAYYERDEHGLPRSWIGRMKESLRIAGAHFTTDRMVSDYARSYYVQALSGDRSGDDPPFESRPSAGMQSDAGAVSDAGAPSDSGASS